jgi:hypothetical protein
MVKANILPCHSLTEPALQKLRESGSWDFEKVDRILMVKNTRSPAALTPAVSQAFSDAVSRIPLHLIPRVIPLPGRGPAELVLKFNDNQTRPNCIWSDSIGEHGIALLGPDAQKPRN